MNLSAATFADTEHSYQPAASEPDAGQAQTRALLVFHLGDRAYGLAVEHVVQIIAMIKLTPVPQVEQVIEGVANIRGKIVPVLSARRHLGLPLVDPQLYTPIILLQTGERTFGLLVDEVADVIRLTASQMTGPETVMPEGFEGVGVLEGVVHQGDTVIMMINPRYLLNPTQMRAFKQAFNMLVEADSSLVQAGAGNEVVEPHLAAPSSGRNGNAQQKKGSEVNARSQVPEKPEAKKQPAGNGHGKSRKGRRNMSDTLAGEIAGLAVDLPPSDGQSPANPGDLPGGIAPDPGVLPSVDSDSEA
jgi:purine-binding chemotaxis protein CheW